MSFSDSLTYTGANKQAEEIRQYWRNRGFSVEVIVEEASLGGQMRVFVIRSDMVNGQPQKRLRKH